MAILRRGGLVVFPTETVYGLGADARQEAAVRRVFEVKRRPASHPVIVHLPSADHLDEWAAEASPLARELARRFWPGALTLVLRRAPHVLDAITGGQETVAVRVPAHPLARRLLERFGGALAAPSANRFGRVSPTTAEHVRSELGEDAELILDGGPCRVGVESTIVDVSAEEPRLLRLGGVTSEQLADAAGDLLEGQPSGEVRVPGSLEAHYAPRAKIVIAPAGEAWTLAAQFHREGTRVGVLAARRPSDAGEDVELVDLPEDDEEAARRLYSALREADARSLGVLVVELPSEAGLWRAIADRLRRAAAS